MANAYTRIIVMNFLRVDRINPITGTSKAREAR